MRTPCDMNITQYVVEDPPRVPPAPLCVILVSRRQKGNWAERGTLRGSAPVPPLPYLVSNAKKIRHRTDTFPNHLAKIIYCFSRPRVLMVRWEGANPLLSTGLTLVRLSGFNNISCLFALRPHPPALRRNSHHSVELIYI